MGIAASAAIAGVTYLLDAPARQERREHAEALAKMEREMSERGLVPMRGPVRRVSHGTP